VFKKSERFLKLFSSDFERSDPKHQFVKFEINSEEFLRVAHPPSKQGTERFSKRFSNDFERSDQKHQYCKI